ncbi:hypothetical protein CY35_07G080400 [Sphagnum magellanicum]|uniref:Uncharacterized protein n=1 Tax=Sphagnum magellanicum TaxID=128215 RepID=A0ACB8HM81_9BRYO|nr:hypothetical protein CY35_07G080400 [Sphagnum magellanicum]
MTTISSKAQASIPPPTELYTAQCWISAGCSNHEETTLKGSKHDAPNLHLFENIPST